MTTIKGLDDLQRKLKTLENFQRKLKKPMEESAALMVDYISKAPRKKAGAFTAMATPGQRRAYWARVNAGEIDHGPYGYRRSSTMARGWTYRIKTSGKGIRAEVGNKKAGAYGMFVQGPYPEWQQDFHRASGWRTTDETLEALDDKIQAKFDKVIKRELNR
jgi:hypothetical protein